MPLFNEMWIEDERVEMIIESEEILIFQDLFHFLLLLLLSRIYMQHIKN